MLECDKVALSIKFAGSKKADEQTELRTVGRGANKTISENQKRSTDQINKHRTLMKQQIARYDKSKYILCVLHILPD